MTGAAALTATSAGHFRLGEALEAARGDLSHAIKFGLAPERALAARMVALLEIASEEIDGLLTELAPVVEARTAEENALTQSEAA